VKYKVELDYLDMAINYKKNYAAFHLVLTVMYLVQQCLVKMSSHFVNERNAVFWYLHCEFEDISE